VPLSANFCGEPAALSLIVIAAVNTPITVGAKCPWMVQLAPSARLVPQLLAKINEDALVPVTAMLVIDRTEVPVLVIVTICEALEVPTCVAGKVTLVVESVTGGVVPVALNVMV